jgi:hypothetical protein
MRLNAIILLLTIFSAKVFSTSQVSDYLILNKDTLYLYSSPLEQIDSIRFKIIFRKSDYFLSSGCWRGFYAEWKIINNMLYLSKVFDCEYNGNINNFIEKILGRKFINGLLEAEWVNGTFWCGKNTANTLSIFHNVYKYEIKLMVENGKIINTKEYNYIPCKYEDKDVLLNFIMKNTNWNNYISNSYLQFEAELRINNLGKLQNVKITQSNNPSFNNEIIICLKQLHCWPVYYWKGGVFNDEVWINIEIKYDKIKLYEKLQSINPVFNANSLIPDKL